MEHAQDAYTTVSLMIFLKLYKSLCVTKVYIQVKYYNVKKGVGVKGAILLLWKAHTH